MRLIAKAIRISRAKFHSNRLTAVYSRLRKYHFLGHSAQIGETLSSDVRSQLVLDGAVFSRQDRLEHPRRLVTVTWTKNCESVGSHTA